MNVRPRGRGSKRGNGEVSKRSDGYEQVWDGLWFNVDTHQYLACCDCALVHLVSFRRRGRKIQARFFRHARMTRALRKRSGKDAK